MMRREKKIDFSQNVTDITSRYVTLSAEFATIGDLRKVIISLTQRRRPAGSDFEMPRYKKFLYPLFRGLRKALCRRESVGGCRVCSWLYLLLSHAETKDDY